MAIIENLKLLFVVSFAGCVAADSGDDFSNNLFTDLAPLLALFGERVTMQFMSQSMGWADNIVLAMAPLGIITAIVSAIRVGGPSWLKAIIGRARENLALAEAELMSSTSKEVCELWNGQEVVRCMGSAPVSEFICLLPEDMSSDGNDSNICPMIVTCDLKEAVDKKYLEDIEEIERAPQISSNESTIEKGQASTSTLAPEIIIIRNTAADAPNITLNCHNQFSRRELNLVAVIGTILQLGVLVYSGFATYYPTLRLLKDDRPIPGYAFPCTAGGTLVLVAGILICAHVVESSTTERTYRPGLGKKARLVWLQQTKTVSDQFFDSSAVFPIDDRTIITTSHRSDRQSQAQVLALKTVVGTMISLYGFAVQFIGLRGMHWSASVAQLGAVVVMTVLRAWVRRGLAKSPQSQPLPSEFELDWFAMTLGDIGNAPWRHVSAAMVDWTIESPNTPEGLRESNDQTSSNAHNIMKIRRDLGRLADWRGPASAEAVSVARSIEIIMDNLFSSSREYFTWSLATRDKQSVHFRLERKDGKWKAYSDELEAALSLWLFSVYQDEHEEGLSKRTPDPGDDAWLRAKGLPAQSSLRILGSYNQALHRDLWWWMPDGAHGVMKLAEDGDVMLEEKNHRIVGHGPQCRLKSGGPGEKPRFKLHELTKPSFDSAERQFGEGEDAGTLLATGSRGPLKSLYAQDMFSAFMWAAAKKLKRSAEGNAEIRHDDIGSNNAWKSFTLRNDQLSKMTREIQSTGLGSLEDIYLSVIPPLSVENKLPKADAIIELARKQAKQHEQLGHWTEAGDAYLWLFRTAKTFPKQSKIFDRATAILMEYQRQVVSAIGLRKSQHEKSDLERLEQLKLDIEKELQTSDPKTLSSLMMLYKEQNRDWKSNLVLETASSEEEGTTYPWTFNRERLHGIYRSSPYPFSVAKEVKNAIEAGDNVNSRDVHDWTPLHYAAAKGEAIHVKTLLQEQADVNAQDLFGWTALHYACRRNKTSILQDLIRNGADINVRARDGIAPLHCAAMNGHQNMVALLISAGAAIDVLDISKNTPLLWATYNGHRDVVNYLYQKTNTSLRNHNGRAALHLATVSEGAEENRLEVVRLLVELGANKEEAKDREGRTPLHLGAKAGHEAITRLLIDLGAADKNAKTSQGYTPLHEAAEAGHEAIVRLLIEAGANIEVTDWRGHTPLHLATKEGHEAIVRLLIEAGAYIEAVNDDKVTPLHLATKKGHEAITRLLIDLGAADKNAKTSYGYMPLHEAAEAGHEAIVRLLIQSGANIEVIN